MSDGDNPSRGEVNAKIETIEARLDAKLAAINGKIDRMFERLQDVISAAERAEKAANAAQESSAKIKWNILFTAVGVAAVMLATWNIWVQGMELVAGLAAVAGAK